MGDRGNIVVLHRGTSRIYLYAHWDGHRLPKLLRDGLALRQRWTDEPYLTRILARAMGMGEPGDVGFGISNEQCDNEYPLLIVDPGKTEVRLEPDRWTSDTILKAGPGPWTFEVFSRLSDADLEWVQTKPEKG